VYGKIFDTIYDGTLVESWQALVTFQQMIVLADADGVIDMTPRAIERRTGIPLEVIEEGIRVLERPDPDSRTPDDQGRRIARLDGHRSWGWYLVNHEKYRKLQDSETVREQNRERKRRERERKRESQEGHELSRSVTEGHASHEKSRHTDTDTDTDTDTRKKTRSSGDDPFGRWWVIYPKKVKKKTAREIWKRKRLDRLTDQLIADVQNRLANDQRWKDGFVPDPTTYLNQERWDDEIAQSTKVAANSLDGFATFEEDKYLGQS